MAPSTGEGFGWKPALRDHGVLWGRPWECWHESDSVVAVFRDEAFRFERTLTLAGNTVTAAYGLRNTGTTAFGYLYSQHMLLNLEVGETIDVAGIGPILQGGRLYQGRDVRWQELQHLNPVRGVDAGIVEKLYAMLTGPARCTVTGQADALELAWTSQDMPAVGLWFAYGGWPSGEAGHQVAIEPTSAPVDALADGGAAWLEPGRGRRWSITATLKTPDEGAERQSR
ncbi:hypothetical protein P1J78_21655 [Psychromarinibacter sp. C21-152]|uniref:Galactose mutarotase n=1 Tax=Psychromarinibacter sediminicola TaxID=3033385 RepID=A0AAE3NTN5_9RHOB|nr:hypothetical protein [Psychromarinibacter sediminicola]MDF0603343.1 hypothetical protein [Psychromarinibacter sediminicola]